MIRSGQEVLQDGLTLLGKKAFIRVSKFAKGPIPACGPNVFDLSTSLPLVQQTIKAIQGL